MSDGSLYPFHQQVQEFFPGFDYLQPPAATRERCDMPRPDNVVGHQQRAVSCYWAVHQCRPTDLGIDFGSPKGMTPYCIHVDVFGDGRVHPYYGGGPYFADIARSAVDADIFPDGGSPLIVSNHSLEHMPAEIYGFKGDQAVAALLDTWLSKLRPGGLLVMVVPDNDHFDVMGSDPDHKHAWGARDFHERVLSKVSSGFELAHYDTLKNRFSFDVVMRKHG